MSDNEVSDFSIGAGPQADVMAMTTIDEPSLRTQSTGEGICIRRSALVEVDGKAQDVLEPEVEEALRAQLAELFGPLPPLSPGLPDAGHHTEVDQEFEFRMFSGEAHKITLREEEGMGDGALVSLRDPRIFVVPRAVGQRKAEFDQMAMAGEEVLERSRRRAWGLEVPWRVNVLKCMGSQASQVTNITIEVEQKPTAGRKTKPNKQRRIILRERTKKAEELAKLTKLEEQNKEEAEREKKSRKNRDKKLKKRAKEKASKATVTVATGTEQVSG